MGEICQADCMIKSSSKEIHISIWKFSLSFFCISPSLQKYICLKNIFLKNTLPNWENKSSFTRFALRDFGSGLWGRSTSLGTERKDYKTLCILNAIPGVKLNPQT